MLDLNFYVNDNNNELYLYYYNNTALRKRGKHGNYSNLVIRVQFIITFV